MEDGSFQEKSPRRWVRLASVYPEHFSRAVGRAILGRVDRAGRPGPGGLSLHISLVEWGPRSAQLRCGVGHTLGSISPSPVGASGIHCSACCIILWDLRGQVLKVNPSFRLWWIGGFLLFCCCFSQERHALNREVAMSFPGAFPALSRSGFCHSFDEITGESL